MSKPFKYLNFLCLITKSNYLLKFQLNSPKICGKFDYLTLFYFSFYFNF